MVVKAKRGRRRYIVFTMDPSYNRDRLIPALRALAGDSAPYVVQCSEGWCIIRTEPDKIEMAHGLMNRIDPSADSKCTSGTLITLRRRYPILQQLRPPARR